MTLGYLHLAVLCTFSFAAVPAQAPTPAKPLSDPKLWVRSDDYPRESLRLEQEGVTEITWTISPAGFPTDCVTKHSSGYQSLDQAACNAIMMRARYIPATDSEGKPVATSDYREVRWFTRRSR
jgi:TonB family protein